MSDTLAKIEAIKQLNETLSLLQSRLSNGNITTFESLSLLKNIRIITNKIADISNSL